MATLERIRRRSGLLIIVIGLAMLAFILTDLLSSGNSIFRSNQSEVGRVNGSSIQYDEFNQRVSREMATVRAQNPQRAQSITRTAVANSVWNQWLREELLFKRFDDLGITVSSEELYDRISSNPQIQQQPNFQDQMTGQFSSAKFQQYLRSIKEQSSSNQEAARMYEQWVNFEESIYENTLGNKFQEIVKKGLYYPSALAEELYMRRQVNSTTQYFGLTFNNVDDQEVEYDDSDLKSYYEENKHQYKGDAERDIAFVSFPVNPSSQDSAALRQELRQYLQPEVVKRRGKRDTFPSFGQSEDDSLFAVGRSDRPVNARYATQEELPSPLDTVIPQQEEGYVHGPFLWDETMALSKLLDETTIPDSVEARHILISYQGANQGQSQSQRSPQKARELADSLLQQFKEDTTGFASTARELSDDPGSGSKGGDLGWFGRDRMVQAFSRFAFLNESGDIGLVFSRFGFHLIHIQDQDGSNPAWKMVHIRREISPSQSTRDSVYDAASSFATQAAQSGDFGAAAQDLGYSARPATGLTVMQERVLGLGRNRDVVSWAFNEKSEVNDIELFDDEDQYIVTTLTGAREKGLRSLAQVREQVTAEIIKQKKAELLSGQLEDAQPAEDNIKAWASSVSKNTQNQNISFATSNITGYGNEPYIVGAATGRPINRTSSILRGDRGVYLLQVSGRTQPDGLSDYSTEQERLAAEVENLAADAIFTSLRDGADIVDNRARFY